MSSPNAALTAEAALCRIGRLVEYDEEIVVAEGEQLVLEAVIPRRARVSDIRPRRRAGEKSCKDQQKGGEEAGHGNRVRESGRTGLS